MSVSQTSRTSEQGRGKKSDRILLGIFFLGLGVLNLLVVFGVPAYLNMGVINDHYRRWVSDARTEIDRLTAEATEWEQNLLTKVESGVPFFHLHGARYIEDPQIKRELLESLCRQLEDSRLQTRARAAELLAQFSSFEELDTQRRSQLVRKMAVWLDDPAMSTMAVKVLGTLGPDAKPALPALSRAMKQCRHGTDLHYVSRHVLTIDPAFNLAAPIVEEVRDDSGASEYFEFAAAYLQRNIPRQTVERAIFDVLQDNPTPEQRQRLEELSRQMVRGTIE